MTVHLQKLCVGINTIQELVQYRDDLAKRLKRGGRPMEDQHWTRHRPKRDEEILDGGSLFWIIKGSLCVRQRIIRLDEVQDEAGKPFCAIVYDPKVILTEPRPRRAFQGWRYLEAGDAPPDLPDQRTALRQAAEAAEMPEEMARELRALGFL